MSEALETERDSVWHAITPACLFQRHIQLGPCWPRSASSACLRAIGGDRVYAAYFRDLDGNKLDVFCCG